MSFVFASLDGAASDVTLNNRALFQVKMLPFSYEKHKADQRPTKGLYLDIIHRQRN